MKQNPVSPLIPLFIRGFAPQPNPTSNGCTIQRSSLQKILVVRLDEIGDVILTSPFLRELRRNLPEARITLLVKSEVYNLVEHCPYVTDILTFPAIRSLRRPSVYVDARRFAIRALRPRDYDLAIVPRWDVDSNAASFIAYFSGAKYRLAYSEKATPEKKICNRHYDRLYTDVVFSDGIKHEVQRNLDLLRYLNLQVESADVEVWNHEKDNDYAEKILALHSVEPCDTLIVLGIGAGHPNKRWPLQNFVELGRSLLSFGCRIVIIGSTQEASLAATLQQQIGRGVINIAGQASLRQTSAVLRRCHLFAGNDSGPMHIAAAMHVPIIEVCCHPKSGNPAHVRSPSRFHPWNIDYRIIQPDSPREPCTEGCDAESAHCICDVTVEMVHSAVVEQLAKGVHERVSH
jgi:heptosyltransferase-2